MGVGPAIIPQSNLPDTCSYMYLSGPANGHSFVANKVEEIDGVVHFWLAGVPVARFGKGIAYTKLDHINEEYVG